MYPLKLGLRIIVAFRETVGNGSHRDDGMTVFRLTVFYRLTFLGTAHLCAVDSYCATDSSRKIAGDVRGYTVYGKNADLSR